MKTSKASQDLFLRTIRQRNQGRSYYGLFESINYAYHHPGTQIFILCVTVEQCKKLFDLAPTILNQFESKYSIQNLFPGRKHIILENEARIIFNVIEENGPTIERNKQ